MARLKLGRGFSSVEPSRDEMKSQIQELKTICEALLVRVNHLTEVVERTSSRNLVDLKSVMDGETVDRHTFRPTIEMAANQVNHARHLDNDSLAALALSGDTFARRERLLREVMQVDCVTWDDAHDRLVEMDIYCEEYYWLQTMPYRVGIALCLAGVFGSCLLVFSKSVALPYAKEIAGEDLPEGVEDIADMTYNQVGSWTWTWMEPMIGTASFVLLCLQFGRAQSSKMKMYPYTEAMLRWRSARVSKRFPQYDGAIIRAWAQTMPTVRMNFLPRYRRFLYTPENRLKNFRGGI